MLLPQLELDGLIFRVDREIGDSSEDYAFKHALVQDALYGSLLTPQKAVLHQKAAEAPEELYGDKAPDVADMLAHHYARTQRAEKAVYYLALAAKKSLRVFSLAEAQAYLDQALVKITAEPDCASDRLLAEIVVDRLLVCCWEADFIGMREIAEKYRARLEAAGDSRELSRILAWLRRSLSQRRPFGEAEQVSIAPGRSARSWRTRSASLTQCGIRCGCTWSRPMAARAMRSKPWRNGCCKQPSD